MIPSEEKITPIMNLFYHAEIIDPNFSKHIKNSTLPDSTIHLILSDISLDSDDLISIKSRVAPILKQISN